MRNLLLIIAILTLHTNLFGQNADRIKNRLDSIAIIIDDLPKTTNFTHDSKCKFTYSKDFKKIVITDLHFEKNSNKKKPDHNVYTFDLSDLDPKFVILKEFDNKENFYIQLLTIDNKPKIKQEVLEKGRVFNTSFQDRVTIGRWEEEHLEKGEKIKSLFISTITETLGDKANLPTSTISGQIKEMIIQTKNGATHILDIPESNPDEEPKYVFGFTDEMPSFEGAKDRNETEKKLEQYFKGKIKNDQPKSSGTVYIQFTIDKTGKPSDINILKGVNTTLDKMAIDYINQMPEWTPGQHKGEKVLVIYTTAVKF